MYGRWYFQLIIIYIIVQQVPSLIRGMEDLGMEFLLLCFTLSIPRPLSPLLPPATSKYETLGIAYPFRMQIFIIEDQYKHTIYLSYCADSAHSAFHINIKRNLKYL